MNVGPFSQPAPTSLAQSDALPFSPPLTCLGGCFFNSFIVGLPCSLIFLQFWLFSVFKLVVILLLVVQGSEAFLPTLPSWPKLLFIFYCFLDFSLYLALAVQSLFVQVCISLCLSFLSISELLRYKDSFSPNSRRLELQFLQIFLVSSLSFSPLLYFWESCQYMYVGVLHVVQRSRLLSFLHFFAQSLNLITYTTLFLILLILFSAVSCLLLI